VTSKTFKSALSANELSVRRASDGLVTLYFETSNIHLDPSDAPALALAVLEAAGVKASFDPDATFGTAEHLGHIQDHLQDYVNAQERAAVEAKERAELEAEALDYWKAFNNATDLVSFDDIQWSDLLPESQAKWLAVARRAREMRESNA